MSREEAIEVEGRVTETLSNRVVRVELSNGHCLLAHLSGTMRKQALTLGPGDLVTVQMTPFDLSRGCIISKQE